MSEFLPSRPVTALPRLFERPVVPNWARVWAGVRDAGRRLLAAARASDGLVNLAGAGSSRKAES